MLYVISYDRRSNIR